MGGLDDLPLDIILDVILYLEPTDFLALCSTSKSLAAIRLEPSYWRHATRSTFRLPNQRLLQSDGARWMRLYRRLRTESTAYSWGSRPATPGIGVWRHQGAGGGQIIDPPFSCPWGVGWPTEMYGQEDLDAIVDLQCGGWSTTLLTCKGHLFSVGVLDSQGFPTRPLIQENLKAHKLKFASLPSSSDEAPEKEPTIAQFSAGRSEILGLSDSGSLWLWSGDATFPGVQVKFRHTDVLMARSMFTKAAHTTNAGRITRAVSGWNGNSAFILGKGIVFWKAHPRLSNRPEPNNNSLAVCVDDMLVPDTHYRRPRGKARDISPEEQQLGNRVGEVISHILLEDYVVFLTDLGKVFAIRHSNRAAFNKGIFELVHFVPSEASGDKMTDLQGSFRSFAVFNLQGEVLIGDQSLLHRAWASAFEPVGASFSADELRPARPPDLQNRGIVALAFGDWHKLALTREGHVLSFGHEPEACGCLGLGTFSGEGLLRGVRYTGAGFRIEGDCEQRWRRLWFSPEQREWLRYLRRGGVNPQEGIQRIAHIPRDQADALAVADWVEQHGSDWDRHPDFADDTEDNVAGQFRRESEPAYMAVSISAGGWGSAALVLRNKKKVERMYRAHAGFLPPPSGSEGGESNAASSDLLTRLRSWWWADNAEAASHPSSAVEDQRAGRHHAYYHSQRAWHVVSRELPESARHEVMLPALPM